MRPPGYQYPITLPLSTSAMVAVCVGGSLGGCIVLCILLRVSWKCLDAHLRKNQNVLEQFRV